MAKVNKDTVRAFCEEYFNNGCNCLKAYISTHPNCSEKSAKSNSYKFMQRPEVEEEMERCREHQEARNIAAVTALQQHLIERIFYDSLDYVGVNPVTGYISIQDLKKLPPYARRMIKQIEPTENGAKIVFESRDNAIATFCKLHGLTKDVADITLTTSEKLADVMNQIGGGVFDDEPDTDETTKNETENHYGF